MSVEQAEIRQAVLHYESIGRGPDMIWGHGLSVHRAVEEALPLLDLARLGVRLVRYDARGHGASQALADHLGIDRYMAAGASMGCGTALHAAVLAPERVRALVLVIPPTGWELRAAQAHLWEATARLLETEGIEAVLAARSEVPPPDPFIGDEGFRAGQTAATRSWDVGRLAHVMRGAAFADLPPREAVAAIDVPALVLAWTGDPIHPVGVAEELAGLIASAELHVASPRAEVDAWTDLVAAFLTASAS